MLQPAGKRILPIPAGFLFVVSLLSVSAAGNGGYHGKVFLIC